MVVRRSLVRLLRGSRFGTLRGAGHVLACRRRLVRLRGCSGTRLRLSGSLRALLGGRWGQVDSRSMFGRRRSPSRRAELPARETRIRLRIIQDQPLNSDWMPRLTLESSYFSRSAGAKAGKLLHGPATLQCRKFAEGLLEPRVAGLDVAANRKVKTREQPPEPAPSTNSPPPSAGRRSAW